MFVSIGEVLLAICGIIATSKLPIWYFVQGTNSKTEDGCKASSSRLRVGTLNFEIINIFSSRLHFFSNSVHKWSECKWDI